MHRAGQTRMCPGRRGLRLTRAKLRREGEMWKTCERTAKGPNLRLERMSFGSIIDVDKVGVGSEPLGAKLRISSRARDITGRACVRNDDHEILRPCVGLSYLAEAVLSPSPFSQSRLTLPKCGRGRFVNIHSLEQSCMTQFNCG